LDILVLGGTGFIGPHIVREALGRGHSVTLFNRGTSNPELFGEEPRVTTLIGDRGAGELAALGAPDDTHRFGAVIDTSAYVPRVVRQALGRLAGRTDHYVFVSTISVFASFAEVDQDEDAPLAELEDPATEEITGETYGGLKVLCEQAAREAMGDAVTILRPGLIVGPGDTTDRFTYWPARFSGGGEVLVPGTPDDPIQVVDARDFAQLVLECAERKTAGTYNVTCEPVRFGEIIEACVEHAAARGVSGLPVWVPGSLLDAHEVRPWVDVPVWIPPGGESPGLHRMNVSRVHELGWSTRPIGQTVADTMGWWASLDEERRRAPKAGWSREDELERLAAMGQGSGEDTEV